MRRRNAHWQKLNDELAAEAVGLYQQGWSCGALGHRFGVSRQAMWDVLRKRTKMRPQLRYGTDNHFYRGTKADDHAQNVLEVAIREGRVTRQTICERCGASGAFRDGRTKVQGHHPDYNKPLDVMWLCQKCHHEWHRVNRAKEVTPTEATACALTAYPQLMSSPEASRSPANPSRSQESAEPSPTNDGCGPSSLDSFASFDPATSSWRTCRVSLFGELETFSATWPPAGTTRSGRAFRLPRLAPRTSATASGSWPTPQATDPTRGPRRPDGKRGISLPEKVGGMWPTPDASIANDGETLESWFARRERERQKHNNGNGFGMPLAIAARIWPTPHGFPKPGQARNPGPSGNELGRAVNRAWPTPTQSDGTGGPGCSGRDGGENLRTAVGAGSLNPRWVEWLMGYPDGWTDLGDSATPSSRKSSSGSAQRSSPTRKQ